MKLILFCGDRNWTNRELIKKQLLWAREVGYDSIIEGEAKGADTIAREEAEKLNIPVIKCPANWVKFGRVAGGIRNTEMLKYQPTFVAAFHNNIENSKGTKNMVEQAKKAGIPHKVVTEELEYFAENN